MPSLLHEGLLALVRNRPEFVVELLRDVFGVEVPEHRAARTAEATLNEIVPVEYHSDLLVVLDADRPVYGVIIEAQLQASERKRFTWPNYGTSARARFECPFAVVVVAPDRATAQWAAQPIDLGGGNSWRPLVLGPDFIPLITDPEKASRSPELAVLSVIAHAGTDRASSEDLAVAVLSALRWLSEEEWVVYLRLVGPVLGAALRKAIQMFSPDLEKYLHESWKVLAAPEIEEARAQARAESLLQVLERRGLLVSDQQRARILGCTDVAQLSSWLDRAVTATTTDELFS